MLSPDRNKQQHPVVSREEWLKARKAHLKNEKSLTHLRDLVNEERRTLPWVKVDKEYVFETPAGKKTLAELFGNNTQLIVYHFMWRWDLGMGCDGCSFLCDHIDGANLHLKHHDVTVVAISRGKLADLQAYRKRMGWQFDLVSSHGSDFNYDYNVSFTKEEMASGEITYNFEKIDSKNGYEELPGTSVFYKDDAGDIFHTYSSYGRGGDILIGAHNFLDLTPKGRNESATMNWMKRHDEYESHGNGTASCCQS
jgi:predicted dithiol-disulfide oxidoreductase (DUF899 family)